MVPIKISKKKSINKYNNNQNQNKTKLTILRRNYKEINKKKVKAIMTLFINKY